MDTKLIEELKAGYTFVNGIIRNPGKFEGETVATLFYYDCFMNGDGVVMEVSEEERKYFEFPEDTKYIYLAESNDGFVSLVHCKSEQEANNLDLESLEYIEEWDGMSEDSDE